MALDLVIANGEVVTPAGREHADVGVRDGRIADIGSAGTVTADQRIDARGLLVLPGAIDMHVHLREPGLERKEDAWHGTRAAAAGGVTLVADMPNTVPPVASADVLTAKARRIADSAWVDVALWAGGTDVAAFAGMQAAGAIGLKVYMTRSLRASDPYSDALAMPDDDTFREVLRESARLGWPVAVHVCDPELEAAERERLRRLAHDDARLVCRALRGPGAAVALRRVLDLADETGARVHIAHISLAPAASVDVLRLARSRGSAVTCELAPPALAEDELVRIGSLGTPFAFPPHECEFYWQALADGTIDCVATDHAPHTRDDKLATPDAWSAPTGYPSVETSLPLMIDAALAGRMSLERVVELTAAAPARILGLEHKGELAVGADADIALVDAGARTVVDERRLHSKAGWSPFHGRSLAGRIVATLLRGVVVARDGEIVGEHPSGRIVQPVTVQA
jgi:dihydroorotase